MEEFYLRVFYTIIIFDVFMLDSCLVLHFFQFMQYFLHLKQNGNVCWYDSWHVLQHYHKPLGGSVGHQH